jgi:hypothetical protein
MATTDNLKKGLNRKLWEMCGPAPVTTGAGTTVISSSNYRSQQLYITSTTVAYLYYPEEDGWVQLPSPALSGTFGAGTCGTAGVVGPSGTATAGTATTLSTNFNIQRDLRGFKIHITGGPGAGDVVDILSNTLGANSVITANFSTTITTASTYRILTPRWYVWNGGTASATSFKYYCFALNTWTALTVTGAFASTTNDAKMACTPSRNLGDFVSFATGTATSGTATTIVNTAKTWATNQWTNYQIRITSGTGAGQIRTISSNTATTITVPTWTTTPDNTSQYSIEGNDDYLYLYGNLTTSTYRYSISSNSWSTMATRGGNASSGLGGNWISKSNDTTWANENIIIDGRRIYSYRGNSTTTLDYYDIPSNTWTNDITYSTKTETIGQGSKHVTVDNFIYTLKDVTGRWLRYDVVTSESYGWSTLIYPQGFGVVGDTAFDYSYVDGTTKLTWIYVILNSSTVMMRCLII